MVLPPQSRRPAPLEVRVKFHHDRNEKGLNVLTTQVGGTVTPLPTVQFRLPTRAGKNALALALIDVSSTNAAATSFALRGGTALLSTLEGIPAQARKVGRGAHGRGC